MNIPHLHEDGIVVKWTHAHQSSSDWIHWVEFKEDNQTARLHTPDQPAKYMDSFWRGNVVQYTRDERNIKTGCGQFLRWENLHEWVSTRRNLQRLS